MWGGALRQAGILAAACHYALDHHVERLAEDHEHARLLAHGLTELGLDVLEPDTNIVFARVPDAAPLVARLAEAGVDVQLAASDRIRCVTHLDVDRDAVERTLAAFRAALS